MHFWSFDFRTVSGRPSQMNSSNFYYCKLRTYQLSICCWRVNWAFQSIVFNSDRNIVLRRFYFIIALTNALTHYWIYCSQRHLLASIENNWLEGPIACLKDKKLKNEFIFELNPSAKLLDHGTKHLTDCAIWAGQRYHVFPAVSVQSWDL